MAASSGNGDWSSPSTTHAPSLSMRATLFAIRNVFPKVRQLQTEELSQWIHEKKNLILLDVREIYEYQVSHLQGAISVTPDEPADQVLEKMFGNGAPTSNNIVHVVAYCSVGYRSSNMAQKIYDELRTMKETGKDVSVVHVYNLEGSIFKWANEGRALVDSENRQTKYCHPYNMVWGKLLDYNMRKSELNTASTEEAGER